MERSELAITKLIILYIIRSLPAVTLSQLTSLALDTLYMDYFGFATAYEGLRNDQMISATFRTDDTERDAAGQSVIRCDLTYQGRAIRETREHKIPAPIRSYLAQASTSWQKDIRLERQLTALYEPDGNGQYQVRLGQSEGEKKLVDLSLTSPDKARARQGGGGWERLPQSMYLGLLALLSDEPVLRQETFVASDHPAALDPAGQELPPRRPMPGEQTLL